MSGKRKRVVLSLQQKIEIVKRLKKGENGNNIAREYSIGTSTVSDIRKNSDSILNFVSVMDKEKGTMNRKTMKKSNFEDVDKALYLWFSQKRSQGQPISGPLICEKALLFNESLNGDASFKASSGWLRNFKLRHGIREIEVQGEKLSASSENAEKFISEFKNLIESENYDEEFIYNADESGLNWRSLPRKTLASADEKSAPGTKLRKERITMLLCANATGNHRLPLLVIGHAKKPRSFKNLKMLPVVYTNQRNAWMNCQIFIEWYDKNFIPEVKQHQKKIGKSGNVVLVLDNAPSHPNAHLLTRENGMFKVIFLPPNVSSIIQPMDQSVIETVKRLYRKQLLRKILLDGVDGPTTMQIDLKECCMMVADAWNLVQVSTLNKSWNKILNRTKQENNEEIHSESFTEGLGNFGFNAEDFQQWIESDENDPGYQILNDEEIILTIKDSNSEAHCENDEADATEESRGPTDAEAYNALEVAMEWLQRQDSVDPVQFLQLKRLRDMAAERRMSSMKQKTLMNFFPKTQ